MKKNRWAATVLIGVSALMLVSCEAPIDVATAGASEHHARSEYSQELHDMLPTEILSNGRVTVVGDPNQPWRVVEVDGSITGFQTDLLAEFSKIFGIPVESELVSGLPAVKLGLQSGRSDVAFGPLVSSEDTRKDLNFIDYTLGKLSFLYPSAAEQIDGYEDLCGQTVSYMDGTVIFDQAVKIINQTCADAGREPIGKLPLADINSVVLALSSERAQFAAMSAHQVSYAKSQNPDKYQYYVSNDEEWPGEDLGMGFDKSQPELTEAFFAAWQVVFDNGVYDELMQKYDMSSIAIDKPVLHISGRDG